MFPKAGKSALGVRPPVDSRTCLEGIIRGLKTGARWQDLPERYPSSTTCLRRHKKWTVDGNIEKAWPRLLRRRHRRKLLHWSQAMEHFRLQKGDADDGKTRRDKSSKIMVMVHGQGIPVSMFVTSAQVAEVKTIEMLFDIRRCGSKVKHLLFGLRSGPVSSIEQRHLDAGNSRDINTASK
ncbi:MAG: transposase [Fuerstiella sp.]|nr:transposase [Fuerstiella sp.]